MDWRFYHLNFAYGLLRYVLKEDIVELTPAKDRFVRAFCLRYLLSHGLHYLLYTAYTICCHTVYTICTPPTLSAAHGLHNLLCRSNFWVHFCIYSTSSGCDGYLMWYVRVHDYYKTRISTSSRSSSHLASIASTRQLTFEVCASFPNSGTRRNMRSFTRRGAFFIVYFLLYSRAPPRTRHASIDTKGSRIAIDKIAVRFSCCTSNHVRATDAAIRRTVSDTLLATIS